MQHSLFETENDQTPPSSSVPLDAVVSKPLLLHGDCLELMRMCIADESIDLTVTSPPYDNLRTYNGNNAQWGEHVWKQVIADLYRVTKQGGVVVWVVGDATIKGSETGISFKQALWAIERGFNLHDTMIFQKAGTGACGSNYAYWQSWEYMFVFSKGRPAHINRIADTVNKRAGAICTKGRIAADGTEKDTKRRIVPKISVRTNIWRFQVGNNGDDQTPHTAQFPEQLAHDHIISWSNEGDIVFDPFMGSGTTGKMAKLLGRKFIGCEIDKEYFELATKRIEAC